VNITFPPPGPNAMAQLILALRQAFSGIVNKDEATSRILMSDDVGQIWQIGITTTGVVTTTTISGKDRGA
jgi:hypothetical protein